MTGVLAVDLGKTLCRAALWTGAERFDAEGPGAAGLAAVNGTATAEHAILAVVRKLLQRSGADLRCHRCDRRGGGAERAGCRAGAGGASAGRAAGDAAGHDERRGL